jgi:hypothetical protein
MIFENIAGIAQEEEYDNCRNQGVLTTLRFFFAKIRVNAL